MTQASLAPASDPLTERIERLLTRHEASKQMVSTLEAQVQALTTEREALQLRLARASQRLDAVIHRLPDWVHLDNEEAQEQEQGEQ